MNRASKVEKLFMLEAALMGSAITAMIFWLIPIIAGWDRVTVLSAITIVVTLSNGIVPTCVSYRTIGKKALCMQTDVSVRVLGDGMVVISSWIENIGYKKFATKVTNLYIDKGEIDDTAKGIVFYQFPRLLKHKEDGSRHDCILAERCADEIMAYPSSSDRGMIVGKIHEEFSCNHVLQHLSHGTVDFLLPGEKFSEDIVVKLGGGVYRVTLVCVSGTKGCECSCSTKQFYVPGYSEERNYKEET